MNYAHGNSDANHKLEQATSRLTDGLKERAARARDIVENVRDKAEDTFREKPYLLPVAAGALGLGVGLLLGSKLTRFIVFTAVGTLVTETFGGEIRRLSKSLIGEFQKNLGPGSRVEGDEDMGGDEGEPSTA